MQLNLPPVNLPPGWTLSAFTDEAGSGIELQIEAARRAGLRFIDLRSADGFNISVLPVEHARKIKAKLDDAGLGVQMLGSPLGKSDIGDDFAPELEKLRHLGELAPVLDCRAVRVFSYYNAGGAAKSEWQDRALDRLARLKEVARSSGLVLYHENERHIFGDLGEDVARLAELRDAHFALIFDFDNFNQSGEDVWATWESLRDKTDAFHLKDSTAQNQHVPAGQGQGQIERILRDALARGWRGPLAIEPHLSHSGAVLATGPSGAQNETFASMPSSESFHIAAKAAWELLALVSGDVI